MRGNRRTRRPDVIARDDDEERSRLLQPDDEDEDNDNDVAHHGISSRHDGQYISEVGFYNCTAFRRICCSSARWFVVYD